MRKLRAAAVDLGAGSCRLSLGEWDDSGGRLQLVHRFANGPVSRGGHLYWDLERLENGIDAGLRACAQIAQSQGGSGAGAIDALGVTGWAVDYVRLGPDQRPLADPFCYRDPRTETAIEEVSALIPRERLYGLTGIQFIRINTLYQLWADRRDGVPAGVGWLNIPESQLHRLTGRAPETAVAEYTNATHTQLLAVETGEWCDEIFERTGLDRRAAPRIVAPGTPLGRLRGELVAGEALAPLAGTEVIAPACHDTAAAVAGIPETSGDWAFISSGTWSLVGTVLDRPCTTPAALAANLTNEGGVGGTIRFLKNVTGLWLLEECLRTWEAAGRRWTTADLIAACQSRPASQAVFNVDRAELMLPGDMPSKINRALIAAGRAPLPSAPDAADAAPEVAAAIFASLAARYGEVVRALASACGRRFRRIYMLGGGSQNAVLNRLVERATGLEVVRGPVESATIGNLAVQFATLENGRAEAATVAAWAERLSAGVRAGATIG
ncbi:MAG TPA: FGGY-family carbohydrate kinase [Terriglobales bacterium]|nr:FGGY-family carbohydrate kinase [Terriglobales bacterium]